MGPCAPFDQGEKPMFYAPIKHWVFDQSEQGQGPIYIVLLKLYHWVMQFESFHWLSHHGL